MGNPGYNLFVPLVGYVALWILGSALFLVYFKIFGIAIDMKRPVAMVKQLPVGLAVVTVPACSFVAFFVAAAIFRYAFSARLDLTHLIYLGVFSLLWTIVLDFLITVVGERIDIRAFPMNLMYLFAWFAIVPAVVLGGR